MSEEEEAGTLGQHPHSKPSPTIGFPLPGQSGAATSPNPPVQVPYPVGPPYYTQGFETNPSDAATVAQTAALKVESLPCCGLGIGWFLFIIGFFLAAIPWYVGAFIVLFIGVDYREKPGYIACSIAAIIAAIAAFFGLIQQAAGW